jgi:NitT/TauT family transport system substrate-binding protein
MRTMILRSRLHIRQATILLPLLLVAAAAGCHRESATVADPAKVKVCYIGLTCEAPIFVAQDRGFFKDEGLDVELVKTNWDSMQQGLSFGNFDATHTLVPYLLKPIEQGVNIKITGGIHKGCLRIQAKINSGIRTVEDLRGKRIGVATMGSPPMIFGNRVLASHGMDVTKDVEWVVYPNDVLERALDQGRVDAVADSEPIGSLLLAKGKVRNIADQATDAPWKDEYCCAVAVNGTLATKNPEKAAKITRALLKAAKWVETNPQAAAKLSVANKFLASSPEMNAVAIAQLRYIPSVSGCRKGIGLLTVEMKERGILNAPTDPAALAARAWQDLPGVTDAWVDSLVVEKVAGGGPPPLDTATLVALAARQSCCAKCCVE